MSVSVVGGYVDLGQIVIPCASGSIAYAVKIPFGNFSAYVLLGSVAVNSRNTDLDIDHFIFGGIGKLQQCLAAGFRLPLAVDDRIGEFLICKRLGELGIETQLLVEGPITSHFITADLSVAYGFHIHRQITLVLNRIIQVDDKAGIMTFREDKPVDGRT